MTSLAQREERRLGGDREADNRDFAQRDRDRILYTSALRRLDGVTQVAAAGEMQVFHNRLTHTLEVAQIARRLAEHLLRSQPERAAALGLDPDIAEAAALAHDLGHPPFGHEGEEALDELVRPHDPDGFEGNAQSFRILTKLSVRHEDFNGLNLSRATLNGVLKYPWFRETAGKRQRKFGAYKTEEDDFNWARSGMRAATRSAEAEIMDWADDVAYSVHDLYDFFRAGLIPLDRLRADEREFEWFSSALRDHWASKDGHPQYSQEALMEVWESILRYFPIDRPFDGTASHRAKLRTFASWLTNRYVRGALPDHPPFKLAGHVDAGSEVTIEPGARIEVDVLKELTAHYVIRNPALATMQHGQRRVIREVFDALFDDAKDGNPRLLTSGPRESLMRALESLKEPKNRSASVARVVTDLISGMTEAQVLQLHGRLTGHAPGSLLEHLA